MSSLPLAGSTYTMVALEQLIQSRIDVINRIAVAKAQWLDALRQYVINAFGQNSPLLADFGFKPPTTKPLTPEQKVAKAEKAAATRKARGTMGKKPKVVAGRWDLAPVALHVVA